MNVKNIFVVLGMARSGTSAITRGLMALGVDLGKEFAPANDVWNPTGFWEDKDIVYKINGGVFNAIDFQPYGITLPERALLTNEKILPFKQTAKELLQQRFANTCAWGFKDPSTLKLLPFWQTIFAELNIHENYIITLRHPLSVAHSYQSLTDTELEIGLLLWFMSLVQAIDETEGKNKIMVSYELLLQNPRYQLARMQKQFNLPNVSNTAADNYAQKFLKTKLHRHDYTHQDLNEHPNLGILPLCNELYTICQRLAKDELTFEDPEFKNQWQLLKAQLAEIFPIYLYLDKNLKKINSLKRQMKTMEKSIAWRLFYPLKKIDDFFRKKRQLKRQGRRISKAYS